MGNTESRVIETSSTVPNKPEMDKENVTLQTMTSDLTLSDRQDSEKMQPQDDTKVVIVGGPLNLKDSFHCDEKKVDDGSSAPSTAEETATAASLVSSPTLLVTPRSEATPANHRVKAWCGKKYYSDLVKESMQYLGNQIEEHVVMVYESPSYETPDTSFVNAKQYFFHDSPAGSPIPRTTLGPQRYAAMTGDAIPVYIKSPPPAELLQHWKNAIPSYVEPKFVHTLDANNHVYAYLPLEQVEKHVNDPSVHYHLAGKDAIPLMTSKTTKLLPDTKQVRPCIAKVNHSMGSRGIFVIRDDEDEQEFMEFLQETGNPPYVVSEFVTIVRNIACHFFIHPNGDIIWLGSSENVRLEDGSWSADSTMDNSQQETLQALQVPGARDVADYCLSLGFSGFCGIDVLIDSDGRGHVVDVNPRVTGTCPALMTFRGMQEKFGYDFGLFRRSTDHAYPGSVAQLVEEVEAHNATHAGKSRIVLFSIAEQSNEKTFLNIGVYGTSLEECETHLNHFSRIFKYKKATYM